MLQSRPGPRRPAPAPAAALALPTGLGPLHGPVRRPLVAGAFGWAERGGRPVFAPYLLLWAVPGAQWSAIAAGTVLGVHDDPGTLGLYVEVRHAAGWASQYGGCLRVLVAVGQPVAAGANLCDLAGGRAAAFGLLLDGHPVNASPYLGLGG